MIVFGFDISVKRVRKPPVVLPAPDLALQWRSRGTLYGLEVQRITGRGISEQGALIAAWSLERGSVSLYLSEDERRRLSEVLRIEPPQEREGDA
jgi:hypothetical protein